MHEEQTNVCVALATTSTGRLSGPDTPTQIAEQIHSCGLSLQVHHLLACHVSGEGGVYGHGYAPERMSGLASTPHNSIKVYCTCLSVPAPDRAAHVNPPAAGAVSAPQDLQQLLPLPLLLLHCPSPQTPAACLRSNKHTTCHSP